MEGRQLCGAIAIVIMAVSVYVARDLFRYAPLSGEPFASSPREGEIAVELAGDPDHAGIYFLPEGSTIGELLREAEVDALSKFAENDRAGTVHAGDRVACDTVRYRVTMGEMSAATRLALDMPIDLNGATREDLMLIPGIGTHTAAKIVEVREKRGRFSRVDELEGMNGMGKKRYDGIRRYLYVKEPSCS